MRYRVLSVLGLAIFAMGAQADGCTIDQQGLCEGPGCGESVDAAIPLPSVDAGPRSFPDAGPCGHCADGTHCNPTTRECVACLSNEDCLADAPVCEPSTSTCVECLSNIDCSGGEVCDETAHRCVDCIADDNCSGDRPYCGPAQVCVGCLEDSQCTSVTAARCGDSHVCEPCIDSLECEGVTDGEVSMSVCDTGVCVECTPETEEAVCGSRACNPRTNTCTDRERGSVGLCESCSADSECDDGATDGDLRCVGVHFRGSERGTYCLVDRDTRSTGECLRRFDSTVVATSENGVSATYCVHDQSMTTCEAVLDFGSGCLGDADCGASDVEDDAFCRNDGSGHRCTYGCTTADDVECTSGRACRTSSDPAYCCTNSSGPGCGS